MGAVLVLSPGASLREMSHRLDPPVFGPYGPSASRGHLLGWCRHCDVKGAEPMLCWCCGRPWSTP